MLLHPCWGPGGAEQGIGLVGQGEDHVKLSGTHSPELFQHGKAVHQMAEIDHQRQKRRLAQRSPSGQQRDTQILSGARINGHAHQQSPTHAVARCFQHQTEGHADGQIPHQNRNRRRKGGGQGFSIHGFYTSFTTVSPHFTRFFSLTQSPYPQFSGRIGKSVSCRPSSKWGFAQCRKFKAL